MMEMIRRRPWLLIVAGLGMLVALSIAFLVIAALYPPTIVGPTGL